MGNQRLSCSSSCCVFPLCIASMHLEAWPGRWMQFEEPSEWGLIAQDAAALHVNSGLQQPWAFRMHDSG